MVIVKLFCADCGLLFLRDIFATNIINPFTILIYLIPTTFLTFWRLHGITHPLRSLNSKVVTMSIIL